MSFELFKNVQTALGDPILGIGEAFKQDRRSEKVNLSVGMYLNEQGVVPILNCVKEAKRRIFNSDVPYTYSPIRGIEKYRQLTQELIFGPDSTVVKEGRVATVQTLGGTGGLRLGMDFLRLHCSTNIGVTSSPTWENHDSLLEMSGFKVCHYDYYDSETKTLNVERMLNSLRRLPQKSVVVLHACCHNPTGYDLTLDQWKEVIEICRNGQLIPLLDMAYQGFKSGLVEDAQVVRLFAKSDLDFLVASSFSKSFNLYGERVGSLNVVTKSTNQAQNVLTQLESIIRSTYSMGPAFGARIVQEVLSDSILRSQWEAEVTQMRERIHQMRQSLYLELKRFNLKRDFYFLTQQVGMFSYTGLSAREVDRLAKDFAIYLVRNGRMCVCGLNPHNVHYVAESIATVID